MSMGSTVQPSPPRVKNRPMAAPAFWSLCCARHGDYAAALKPHQKELRMTEAGLAGTTFPVRDYDLAATLNGGQAFRWEERDGAWEGVVRGRWARLQQVREGIRACWLRAGDERTSLAGLRSVPPHPGPLPQGEGVAVPARGRFQSAQSIHESATVLPLPKGEGRGEGEGSVIQSPVTRLTQAGEGAFLPASASECQWLADYLQVQVDLEAVLASLPDDAPMRAAARACRGLRLLRQEPWECLASFLLSSTKQIVQIQQVIRQLCQRFGDKVPVPAGHPPAVSFPSAARLAGCSEAELRACKMGFRAPYLLETAGTVAQGRVPLDTLGALPLEQARAELLRLPGVGRKIADCVLLFAGGFNRAFPVDVWMLKALRRFPHCPSNPREFADTHFGPNAGYAQQYLFHHIRSAHA
jgi:N-glycosylase/DNA lyase